MAYPGNDWMERARCAGIDGNLFFPDKGFSTAPAKKYCADCPVTRECLAWMMRVGPEVGGVFGDTSEKERRKIKRAQRAA
jgi:WhiB family redox-sensing transcriptional regulator